MSDQNIIRSRFPDRNNFKQNRNHVEATETGRDCGVHMSTQMNNLVRSLEYR